jgi:hypothetical protein
MRRRKQSQTALALRDPRNAGSFIFFTLCLLTGGGAVEFGPRLGLQVLAALVLVAWTWPKGEERQDLMQSAPSSLRWLALAFILVPLMQLVPLPAEIWQILPGREFDLAVRKAVGAESGSFPISISPLDTALTPFALVVLGAVTYAALISSYSSIRAYYWLLVGFAALNVVIGVLQLASGGGSLDFYDSPHSTNLLGLFSNRNHTALFLAASIPIAFHLIYSSRFEANVRLAATGLTLIIGWAGIIGTTSRAGIALGVLATIGAFFLSRKEWIARKRNAAWQLIVAVGIASIGILFALSARTEYILSRLSDIDQDLRWEIWTRSLQLVGDSWPIGAGFGTFQSYYRRFETSDDLRGQFINNAHNDILEVLIEGGLPSGMLLLFTIVLLGWATMRILRREGATIKSPIVAMLIFPWLAVAHSMVDYPMRRMTIAVPVIFIFVLALRWAKEPNRS